VGKNADLYIHPGCDHAFFNDTRPEVYNAQEAQRAWRDTLEFFRAELS
jgi:carboxymethylenebutenolidase